MHTFTLIVPETCRPYNLVIGPTPFSRQPIKKILIDITKDIPCSIEMSLAKAVAVCGK
jgi:hypothetical protein